MARAASGAYFKREFSYEALRLEHHNRRDFTVSRWQRGTSPLPLLVLRGALLAGVLAIWLGSFIEFEVTRIIWFIYVTHWALTLQVLHTASAFALSALTYFRKVPDTSLGVSWYEKAYWVLHNICTPIAFVITVFYWSVLYSPHDPKEDYQSPLLLDIAVHGLNSVVALASLLAVAHPSRLLHFYQPLVFGLAYAIFGLIYHAAGGVNRNGRPWVYSVINWSLPGRTLGIVTGTLVLILLLHALVVSLALARDALARRFLQEPRARAPRPEASNRLALPVAS